MNKRSEPKVESEQQGDMRKSSANLAPSPDTYYVYHDGDVRSGHSLGSSVCRSEIQVKCTIRERGVWCTPEPWPYRDGP